MTVLQRKQAPSDKQILRQFKRREFLPMIENLLWKIDSGFVRTQALHEDGTNITLGLWGVGDVVGYSLAGIEPYQIECLSNVEVHRLTADECLDLDQVRQSHIHQSQMMLMIRHGNMRERFKQFLSWHALKCGTKSEEGCTLPHQLTHFDVADILGTSRVSVTRMIGDLEEEGFIRWSKKDCFVHHGFCTI